MRPAPHDALGVLRVAFRRFLREDLTDRAAALTYYAILSVFPALLITAAIVRLLGDDSVAEDVRMYVTDKGASASLAGTLDGIISTAFEASDTGAGTIGLVSLATLVYGISRAFSAAGRSLDVIAGAATVSRSLRRRALDIAWSLVILACLLVATLLAFASGSLLGELLRVLGWSDGARLAWELLRLPAIALLWLLTYAIVQSTATTGPWRRLRIATPGGLIATTIWMVGTVGYSLYVLHVAHLNATYGAFAAIVILLFWLWMTSMSFLFGAVVDRVVDERRAAAP